MYTGSTLSSNLYTCMCVCQLIERCFFTILTARSLLRLTTTLLANIVIYLWCLYILYFQTYGRGSKWGKNGHIFIACRSGTAAVWAICENVTCKVLVFNCLEISMWTLAMSFDVYDLTALSHMYSLITNSSLVFTISLLHYDSSLLWVVYLTLSVCQFHSVPSVVMLYVFVFCMSVCCLFSESGKRWFQLAGAS